MSDEAQECYEKYLANAAFGVALDKVFSATTGWSCVVRFYAALHLVNAFLIDKKNVQLNPGETAHSDRKLALERCPELRDAPRKYRELKDLSERVRYDATYEHTVERHEMSKAFFDKVVAIVEPKLKKA